MKKILKVLMEIFIWTVAFAAAIIMACTLLAWVAGIAYFFLKVVHGCA